MGGDDRNAIGLTRALFLGVTVGAVPLLQIGCTPQDQAPAASAPAAATAQAATPAPGTSERELCARALETRSVRDVDQLIRTYPDGECVAPTLAAMPPATLRGLSPVAVQGLSPGVRTQIPANAQRQLRGLSGAQSSY